MHGFLNLEPKAPDLTMKSSARESELLLRRLASSGLEVGRADKSQMELGLGPADYIPVRDWLSTLPPDGDREWIAIGPGSKMPAKRWPLARFQQVVSELISDFDVWPVVFGGPEDEVIGDWLLARWGRGYNAASSLGIRSSLAAMKRCQFFLGNDTGTMHMAAGVGLRCVAIFSSRERPGLWYPHGEGHRVFRTTIDCEGCGLVECLERGNECINRVTTEEVLDACRAMLVNARSRELVARG